MRSKHVIWNKTCMRCSIQYCLFVQFWPGVFLVQCQENLFNDGAAIGATVYYRKINRSKKKLVKSDVLFYFYIFIWWIRTVLICQLSNKKLFKNDIIFRRHCTWFFPLQCCLESLWEHCTNFYLCNVVPRVLRQHWTGFFPVL